MKSAVEADVKAIEGKKIAPEMFEEAKPFFPENWDPRLRQFCYRKMAGCHINKAVVRCLTDGSSSNSDRDAMISLARWIDTKILDLGPCFARTSWWSMKPELGPFEDGGQVLSAMANSVKVPESLTIIQSNGAIPNLVLSEWLDFHPMQEWRMFVIDGRCVAGTQYWPEERIGGMTARRMGNVISSYMPKLTPYLPSKRCAVDVVTFKHGFHLIEVNPLSRSDTGQFDMRELEDIAKQSKNNPVWYRFTDTGGTKRQIGAA